jgi:hypothetical protein
VVEVEEGEFSYTEVGLYDDEIALYNEFLASKER